MEQRYGNKKVGMAFMELRKAVALSRSYLLVTLAGPLLAASQCDAQTFAVTSFSVGSGYTTQPAGLSSSGAHQIPESVHDGRAKCDAGGQPKTVLRIGGHARQPVAANCCRHPQ
jgi:hypothetical protein